MVVTIGLGATVNANEASNRSERPNHHSRANDCHRAHLVSLSSAKPWRTVVAEVTMRREKSLPAVPAWHVAPTVHWETDD